MGRSTMTNKTIIALVAGIIIGLATPYLIDMALFGDFTPCQTTKLYEDGSSIQACRVRN